MFFTYLWRELRRRARQAIFIAVGLALGIGLVITVTAASAGVKNAQSTVLHSLYGVGTDITVTKTPTTSATGGGGFGFSFRQNTGTNKRPAAGSKINDNTLTSDLTLSSLSSPNVTTISKLTTWRPRRAASRSPTARCPGRSRPSTPGGGGGDGPAAPAAAAAAAAPDRRRLHRRRHLQLHHQQLQRHRRRHQPRPARPAVHRHRQLRPHLHHGRRQQGRRARQASYATSEKLKVGSTIAVGNSKGTATNVTVVGIVSEPSGDSPSDVYLPLGVAQSLANLKNDVNTIYVSATSNNDITTLANTIKSTVSGSTVTDENSLASEVTGSLSSAASLANSLGKWLAIAVLIAAFLLASLLTMSAVRAASVSSAR